jgi:hypothetical protein
MLLREHYANRKEFSGRMNLNKLSRVNPPFPKMEKYYVVDALFLF